MDEVTEIDAIVWNWDNEHYQEVSAEVLERIIKNELNNVKKAFVSIGFFLRVADEKRIYEEQGYKDLWTYAQETYGISRSSASRYMQINKRFSKGGSSAILDKQYRGFSRSQLQEMLALSDDKLAEITPDMTVKDIRQIAKPDPEPEPEETPAEDIPGQMVIEDYPDVLPKDEPEKLSVCGLPLSPHPEGSLSAAPCFMCHRDCEIRLEECNCLEAPLGNPFPCAQLNAVESLRHDIGSVCQFVNLDLAETRYDKTSVPCCKNCGNQCDHACDHACDRVAGVKAEIQKSCATSHKTDEVEAPHFTMDGENGEKLAGWDYCEAVRAYVLAKDGWTSDMGITRISVYAYEYTAVKSPAKKIVKFYRGNGTLDFTVDYDLLDKQYEFQSKREEALRERESVPKLEESGTTEKKTAELDVPKVKSKTEWPEVLAGMPRYKSLAVKDYLEDAEQELKEYVTLNEAEKNERRKIPERTMAKEYMRVEGLRLLLALVERMERTENDGEE
jgi:hypothetical protein